MNSKAETLEALGQKGSVLSKKSALVGFDGFVNHILVPVDQRTGPRDSYRPIESIAAFGERISGAAGVGTNIEVVPGREKIGGNGPILSHALLSAGLPVKFIGAMGSPDIYPVFEDLAQKTDAQSLCDPGITHALEFEDGTVMLNNAAALDKITFSNILATVGEGAFFDAVSRADVLALVNWTMIPEMTSIFSALLEKVFPNLGPRQEGRLFFFDLADPEKRSQGELKNALNTIARFCNHGKVILGLNQKEAAQVLSALNEVSSLENEDSYRRAASLVRQSLQIQCVVIHSPRGAAGATKEDSSWIDGPFVEKPRITSGAGDHFNSGLLVAQLMEINLPACLTLATAFAGYYVLHGKSPSLMELDTFIRNWS